MSKRSRSTPDEEAELDRFLREAEGLGGGRGGGRGSSDAEAEAEYVPLKQRQQAELTRMSERRGLRRKAIAEAEADDGDSEPAGGGGGGASDGTATVKREPQPSSYKEALPAAPARGSTSLLQQAAALRRVKDTLDVRSRKVLEQEQVSDSDSDSDSNGELRLNWRCCGIGSVA